MIPGSAERPNSFPKKRFNSALLLHRLSDWTSASSHKEQILFPVQQVHLCFHSTYCFSLFTTLSGPTSSSVTSLYFFDLCLLLCREIIQPRDMITIPADDNTYMHFCGQFCLSVFRHKKKHTDKVPDKWIDKRVERKPDKLPEKPMERVTEKPFCSVCRVTNRVRC